MPRVNLKSSSGFTLIELLVTIGILAVLATVTVLVISPTQIFAQARDSRRLSDLQTINGAMKFVSLQGLSEGSANTVYISIPDTSGTCANLGLPALPAGYTYACATAANFRKVDGTGWIPVNFTQLSTGSPLPTLPIDPINTTSTGSYYTYTPGGSWELNGFLESQKYRDDYSVSKPNLPGIIALGTNFSLSPLASTTGLVGYWTFDEGTGTSAADSSGSGNSSNLIGSPAWSSGGRVGGALSFDGANDYVDTPAMSFLGQSNASFSVSVWVKPNVVAGTIVHNKNDSTGWSTGLLGYVGGKLCFYVYANGCLLSPNTASAGDWMSVVVTRDGATGVNKIYENGVQVSASTNTYSPSGGSQKFRFGVYFADCCTMDAPGWFNGLMDDARLYSRALSASEVFALYSAAR